MEGILAKGTLPNIVNRRTREKLSANRTYYVRTDGNDNNTGLENSASGALLTIQAAINAAAALDCSIYDITIQLADGTYTVTSEITLKSILGSGSVTIIGNETTPANVIVDGQGIQSIFHATAVSYTVYNLRGMMVKSSTSNVTFGIFSQCFSIIKFQNIDFNTGITQQIRAADGGYIEVTGNYTISGSPGGAHIGMVNGTFRCQSRTITLTGTPAWGASTAFIDCSYGSVAIYNGCTFSGSATGVRYLVQLNSACYVAGGGADYFPGDSAGSTATGGQYA